MTHKQWLKVVLALCLGMSQRIEAVTITEIHYNPDVKTEAVEFIEIYNETQTTVDLSGWRLTGAIDFTFPLGSSLDASAYAVIGQDLTALQKKWPVIQIFPHYGPFQGQLNNYGDSVVLRDAQGHIVDEVDYKLGFPWPTVGDPIDAPGSGCSIQLVNLSADNNLGGNWRSGTPTPALPNADVALENTPPIIRQVKNKPQQPVSGQPVVITAKVTDSDGVAQVLLWTQQVEPGAYFSLDDKALYEALWDSTPMHDDGLNGDAVAGDSIYSVQLDGSFQTNRTLIRYRISAKDTLGNELTIPYADDPQPNFAYFVYDGVPAWQGAIRPGIDPVVTFDKSVMNKLPVYHLISDNQDVEDCTWNSHYTGSNYQWPGTLVYDGKVYDHIHYRTRGGVWRYAMGKNMWKFKFNRGHYFQARDDVGKKYKTLWKKLNFSACIQQGDYLHRGEQGMFEAATFRLFNMMGVPSPKTHWLEFRIIDDAEETGKTQYDGDLWGLYMAIEQPDGHFLDEHDLPDGNFYKMENYSVGSNGKTSQENQGPTAVSDWSDLHTFVSHMGSGDEQWWQDNVDMDRYYSYRCVVEGVHDGDIGYGKNYFFYLNPDTQHWSILPWDKDLTWAENMYGNGRDPFLSAGVLNQENLHIAYRNRMREFMDLLYNPDQMDQLLDELAAVIWDPNGGPSPVDYDRDMWDYNPVMISNKVNPSKAGQGRFYQAAATQDFAGMVQLMKDYVPYCINNTRDWWHTSGPSMTEIAADEAIPDTPEIQYAGASDFAANDLHFTVSPFSDPQGSDTFKALKWRLARVEPFSDPNTAYDTQTLTPIDSGDTWAYFKGRSAPQGSETLWTGPNFDDSTWLRGPAPIGYDDNGQITLGTVLDDMRSHYSTVYLRKTFTVDKSIDYDKITLAVRYNDAIAVYLNGYFVKALNVDTGSLAYNSLANGNQNVSSFTTIDLTPLLLLLADGTNVLAVHLFNASPNSSDCFFDARLTLHTPETQDTTPLSDRPIVTGRRGHYEINALWDSNEIPVYTDSIQVPATAVEPGKTYRVRCRMEDNTGRWSHWSAPIQFTATADLANSLQDQLRITEIMFNPRPAPNGSSYNNDDFEFLELTNISSQSLDLSTLSFTQGIHFDFAGAAIQSLSPGQCLLLVKNHAAFVDRYGTSYDDIIAGEYQGQLSNGGETLELVDTYQGVVLHFTYDDHWIARTDGDGYSLELIDPQTPVESLGQANSWQASAALDGSPGVP